MRSNRWRQAMMVVEDRRQDGASACAPSESWGLEIQLICIGIISNYLKKNHKNWREDLVVGVAYCRLPATYTHF